MKKQMMLLGCMALLAFAGCGSQSGSAPASGNSAQAENAKVLEGEVTEKKDFMFTVKDSGGTEYALSFDAAKAPEGYDKIKEGDKVKVSYTGELSETEAFTGSILSLEVLP